MELVKGGVIRLSPATEKLSDGADQAIGGIEDRRMELKAIGPH